MKKEYTDRQGERVVTRNHNQERVGKGLVVKSFESFPALKAEHPDAREAWMRVGKPSENQPWHLITTDSNLMISYPEEWIEIID